MTCPMYHAKMISVPEMQMDECLKCGTMLFEIDDEPEKND